MLLKVVKMLKKRLGIEAIERDWENFLGNLIYCYKISSTLIIPEGCRVIGERSFENCVRLKEVKIPESVKEIGDFAFEGCYELEEVVIPESVVKIRYGAFWNCLELKKVVISEGIKEIGDYAFRYCEKLEKVEIPKSVEEVGISAFWRCDNAEITLKKAKSEFIIGKDAFYNCKSVEYVEEEIWI